MALKTFVKLSSVNNLSDARYGAGMYVNLLGFNLENSSKNFVSPQVYKEITGWLSGIEYVAEFESTHPERILEILKDYPELNNIEVTEPLHLSMLINTSYGLILKCVIRSPEDLDDLISRSSGYDSNDVTLLLVSDILGLAPSVTSRIKALAAQCQVLLGFGLEADHVVSLIEETGVKGISLQGGDEVKPGLKDFDELAEILEVLEEDD